MRCALCRKKAVYAPLRFCKEHFLAFYEKKVRHYLESTHVQNTKVLIAVSGGKDSSALVDILVHLREEFGLELGIFTINLRIPDYSEKGLEVCRTLAERYDLPLIVEDLADYPRQIPDFAGKGKKPCSQCGVIKRYLLNKNAWEHGYEYLATGHNMDDEFFVAMHNLLHRNLGQLRRQQKLLPPVPERRLAGRLKPLWYLTEKENRLYCLLRGIPHDADECPFSHDNPQLRFKREHAFPRDEKRNLLKSIEQLERAAGEEGTREKGAEGEVRAGQGGASGGEIHPCPKCGYPTTSRKECVFCTVMGLREESKE